MANQQATLTNIPLKAGVNLNKIECDIKQYSGFHDDNALYIGGVKNNPYKKQFWNGKTDGTNAFICHKDNKNYYAVNKGLNNIAVIEDTVTDEGTNTRLVTLINNASMFNRTETGNYEEKFEETLGDYLINWGFQNGMIIINVKIDNTTYTLPWTTSCKSIKADLVGNTGILFTIYDKYAAKKISSTSCVYFQLSNKRFYILDNRTTGKYSFVWKAGDNYLYVGLDTTGADKQGGIQVLDEQDFTDKLTLVEPSDGNSYGWCSFSEITLSNGSSLDEETLSVSSEPVVRCNGVGAEVGIRRPASLYSGLTEDLYVYFNKDGELITRYNGEDYDFYSIAGDVNYGLWSGGIQEHINGSFDVTYYSGAPFCISSRNNRIKAEHNIEEILWDECTSTDVVYTFENKKYTLTLIQQDAGQIDFEVMNDYVFFNVDDEHNTLRLSDGKVFNRCDDYVNLAIPYVKAGVDGTYFVDDNVYAMFATGYHVLFSRDNYTDIGMVLAPLVVKKAFTSEAYSYYLPSDYNGDILAFWGKTSKDSTSLNAPTYFTTLLNGYNSDYENVYYPVTSSNIIYNPSILDSIEDTFFDEYLFNDGQYSYVSTRTQNQSIVLGYYINTLAEFNKLFIISGTHYAVQGNYIIQLNIANGQISGVKPLAYIGDFQYIGATVSEALFWSPIDKSFYTFNGALKMNKFIESNRIEKINGYFSQPSLSCIVCATNDGILFFYGDQMIRLPIVTENRIYYTNNSFVIDNYEYCFFKRDGYEKEPVQIETEFYSSQAFYEETNDCVYITLFDEEPVKGTLELSCMTLKEGQFKSEKKIFNITPSMFDKDQKYLRLRYQPQYQTGAFSFKIKSDYPIANLAISHRANNIANSRYND